MLKLIKKIRYIGLLLRDIVKMKIKLKIKFSDIAEAGCISAASRCSNWPIVITGYTLDQSLVLSRQNFYRLKYNIVRNVLKHQDPSII